MTILRTERMDYGGIQVIDSRDSDSPVYLAPHLLPEMFADGALTAAGTILVDGVILNRHESKEQGNGLYPE